MTLRQPLMLVGLLACASPVIAQDVKVGGTVEFNYTYNGNKPAGQVNGATGAPYYFNGKSSAFSLNYGEIHVYSDATKERPSGFSFRLVDGAVVAGLPLRTPGVNTNTALFYEAYGRGVYELGGKSLTVDAGIFPTHVGYETINVGGNSFLSKTFHFGQLQPFYHAGLRAALPIDASTTFTGLVFNRYNGVDTNGNTTPGVGFQVARTLGSASSVYLNGAFAKDTVGGGERQKNILNVVYNRTLSGTTSIAADISAVSGKKAGDANYTAQAVSLYAFLGLGGGDKLALRGEYLTENSAGGQLLPSSVGTTKPNLSSITASYELGKLARPGSRTWLEFRFDSANTAVFPTATGAKKNGSTISFVQTYSF
ncbi:MAG: outer membrane beta-barrel protein [Armatimonadota bacterium]